MHIVCVCSNAAKFISSSLYHSTDEKPPKNLRIEDLVMYLKHHAPRLPFLVDSTSRQCG
jgi:hypothetical protein